MLKGIQDEIIRLKKETDTAVLAHSYQSPAVLEIADETGDSFALSTVAAKLPQKNIIMCGVRFMAETVKVLAPEKKVYLASPTAACPMAMMIKPEEIVEYKKNHPDTVVVAYVNTTTAIKAVCDVCVTSSSAVSIVSKIDKPILFVPDVNLGTFIKKSFPEKDITLWNGCCPVHNSVTEEEVLNVKKLYPDAKIAMHPELPDEVLKHADYIGATSGIIKFAEGCDDDVIIGTEKSIADYLSLKFPERAFPVMSKKLICPDMRITNLGDVLRALKGNGFEIDVPEDVRINAKKAIDKMIELG